MVFTSFITSRSTASSGRCACGDQSRERLHKTDDGTDKLSNAQENCVPIKFLPLLSWIPICQRRPLVRPSVHLSVPEPPTEVSIVPLLPNSTRRSVFSTNLRNFHRPHIITCFHSCILFSYSPSSFFFPRSKNSLRGRVACHLILTLVLVPPFPLSTPSFRPSQISPIALSIVSPVYLENHLVSRIVL